MSELNELEKLPTMEVGQSLTLTGTTAEKVREHLKENQIKTSCRIVEIGTGMVTVVRTQGRVSKMKTHLIEQVEQMHPFERLHVTNYKLPYVRTALKEYQESTRIPINCDHSVHSSEESEVIEIWKDPFTSWGESSSDLRVFIYSFIKQCADHFDCSEQDVKNQIELVLASDEETAETVDTQD
jgi:hypothetical protein